MARLDPSPQTTLLILLGASSWPLSELPSSTAFENAVRDLKAYFLSDQNGFHLPESNVLNLFNSDELGPAILNRISVFLEERKESGAGVRDILVYFVGHGGITSDSSTFYLAIHRTEKDYEKGTSIAIDDLAERLKKGARFQRRILILDCCFAAAAVNSLQGPATTVLLREKTIAAFGEKDQGKGFPSKGTSFLGSSGKDTPSVILPDKSSTMFTSALLSALRTGDRSQEQDRLSLHTVHRLTIDFLSKTYRNNFPWPELHSPDQTEGKVEDVPFFPNPAVEANETPVDVTALPPGLPSQQPRVPDEPGPVDKIRRGVVVGLAVAVVGVTGSGLVWLVRSQQPTAHTPFVSITPHTLVTSPTTPPTSVSTPTPTPLSVGTPLYTYRGHSGPANAVVWSHDGQRVASGSDDHTVQVWDTLTGLHPLIYRGHSNGVNGVAWSPNGKLIASSSRDGTVQVWDPTDPVAAAQGNSTYEYDGHKNTVKHVAWSPNGQRIASASYDKTVKVWDATTGSNETTYSKHTDAVLNVAWSPNGLYIASASADKTAQIWNVITGDTLRIYTGHNYGVNGVAWSPPDGKFLVTASDDTKVMIWQVPRFA